MQSAGLLLGIVILGQFASGDPYWVGLITTATILYILAASLNLLFGFAGLFALGQQGLYAVGAYLSTIIGIHLTSLPWILYVIGGVLGSGSDRLPARAPDRASPRRVSRARDDRLRCRRAGRADRMDRRHRGS